MSGKLVICLHGLCLFVCLFVCSYFVIICVEGILGMKHGTLLGRGVWVAGMRNVHLVIFVRWARLVAYMRLIKEHICQETSRKAICGRIGHDP